MQESWKKIKGYNYSVSTKGRVRNSSTLRILKPFKVGIGYLSVKLYKNKKGVNHVIHRLVAIAFIPNPENKPEVDHIDRDISNNNEWNLRWATVKENFENRTMINRSSITKVLIREILSLSKFGNSVTEIQNILKNKVKI